MNLLKYVTTIPLLMTFALAGGFSPQELRHIYFTSSFKEDGEANNYYGRGIFNYESREAYKTNSGNIVVYGNGKKPASGKFSIAYFSSNSKVPIRELVTDGKISEVYKGSNFIAFSVVLDSAAIQEKSYVLDTSLGSFLDVPSGYIIRSKYLDKIAAEYNPPTFVLDSEPAYSNARRVYLGIFDFRTRVFYKKYIDIPPRLGCGRINFAENYRDDRVWNGAYLTVKRQDICGIFSYTINWYN